MLILGRRIGEKLLIPELDIEICIMGIEGRQVRVGVQAPKKVTILREEVHLRNQETQNQKSKEA